MSGIALVYNRLKGDKLIWLIVTILAIFSVLAVYSAVGSMAYKVHGGNTELKLLKQIFFLGAGMGCMYVAYKLDYMQYSKWAPILLLIAIPLLAYTIMFGPEINDARRWLTIPWIDQRFQTSDFAKLALIIFMARSISKKQEIIKDLKSAFLPLIIPVIIVCGLIMPSDFSTAALLFFTCLLMMIIGRVQVKFLFLLMFVGIAAFSLVVIIGYAFPEHIRIETWISRVTEFLGGGDGGYQVQQSKIAIAEGGWFGVMPGNSIQRNYLPVPYADYIYAIICEEYGLIGGLLILALYLGLLIRCTKMVTQCPKTFGAILAMGLCLNIVVQAFANIAVSVNLLPVTGLTLPLVSMGGTSLIMTCISLGIILSVSRYVETAKLQHVELTEIEEDESNH
ncbi:FtsW/RodA/SpoVE family cell cycle protein [Portibacter lacus]|uniref:Probable peptidoglycan glycosyltransferase FtsW n=1 Tax=Portibacter lacus TaxID=1099794 RepID=A0AA37SNF0_9BACT|nr:FtsW/RodA/SpoVE family cell cycle protein [Portibacter lacus]GLR15768.1 cell division protein FtsW [Portibacter lacus]